MSLAQIIYPPPSQSGLEEWFHAHARHHDAIVAAFAQTKNVQLANLGLYPVNVKQMADWLQRHQTMHNDMCQVAGIAGTDLSGLDLTKKNLADAWFFAHFLQHQAIGEACGLPI